jgi:hypothetical protein
MWYPFVMHFLPVGAEHPFSTKNPKSIYRVQLTQNKV